MGVNRGKDFEDVFKQAVERVPNTSIIRLHDQTTGFTGSKNPCDFIMYHFPFMYAIECKSVHGNRLPFSNVTDYQWSELNKLSKTHGIIAGIVCWWIDRDVTLFMPIDLLLALKSNGAKSVPYDIAEDKQFYTVTIKGRKKRVFFEYDLTDFFEELGKKSLL